MLTDKLILTESKNVVTENMFAHKKFKITFWCLQKEKEWLDDESWHYVYIPHTDSEYITADSKEEAEEEFAWKHSTDWEEYRIENIEEVDLSEDPKEEERIANLRKLANGENPFIFRKPRADEIEKAKLYFSEKTDDTEVKEDIEKHDILNPKRWNEDKNTNLSFDNFLKEAEVILVDDARTFDINKADLDDIEEDDEILVEVADANKEENNKPEFLKYSLSEEDVKKVIDLIISQETFSIDKYWKTNQFKKAFDLKDKDLIEIIKQLKITDYKCNSKPVDAGNDKKEAIIFLKSDAVTLKGKQIGPVRLFIKLDYASISACPVVIISFHGKLPIVSGLMEDIEKHDTLNPKLWNEDNTLKSEVEEKINLIVNNFLDGLKENEIKINVTDIKLVGSNCSYNYNKDSDLDVHIVADTDSLECPDNLYPLLYSAYRSIWNGKFDVEFYGIPVELFVETSDTEQMVDPAEAELKEARQQTALKSNGVYSVMHKKWIKEPVAADIPEIDREAFEKEFKKWEDRYFDLIEGK